MVQKFVILLFVILLGAVFASSASAAGWVLYDDFSNGFNGAKWAKYTDNGKTGNIYVDKKNGKLVIKQWNTSSGKSVAAIIKQHHDRIRGIRADVKVQKCPGQPRAQLGAWIANWGNSRGSKQVWGVTEIRPYGGVDKRMGGYTTIEEYDSNGNHLGYLHDESWGGMPSTAPLWGKWRKLTLRWDNAKKWVEWQGIPLNRIQRFFPTNKATPPASNKWFGIRTRRYDNTPGACTARIDNVELYLN